MAGTSAPRATPDRTFPTAPPGEKGAHGNGKRDTAAGAIGRMTNRPRETIRKSIDKAGVQLTEAKQLLETSYGRNKHSDAIGAAQLCIELSVKGALALLGVRAGRTHGKGKDWLKSVNNQIVEMGLLEKLEARKPGYFGGGRAVGRQKFQGCHLGCQFFCTTNWPT